MRKPLTPVVIVGRVGDKQVSDETSNTVNFNTVIRGRYCTISMWPTVA